MVALQAMSATVEAIFWVVAVLCFLLAAFNVATKVNLIAAGLAVASTIYLWAALVRA